MAAQVFTLASAFVELTAALKGTGVAGTSVGTAAAYAAINSAIAETLADVNLPELCGDLCVSDEITITAGAGSLPSDCLLPFAVEITDKMATRKALTEVVRARLTALPGTAEYVYAFAGSGIIVRPTVAAVTLHYCSIPTLLVAGVDALETSPALFRAIVLRAAIISLGSWAGAAPEDIQRVSQEYWSIVDRFTGRHDQELLKAFAELTKRSVKYGAAAGGSGL